MVRSEPDGQDDRGTHNNVKSEPTTSTNAVLRLIQYHYRTTGYTKSEALQSREQWLLPGIPFSRWYMLPAAVIIQFCCGSLYAWSVFNIPIDKLIYGEVTNTAPITFYIAVCFFGTSAALTGPWLERRGPMISCLVGTSLFFLGNLLTALALYTLQMWLVFIGYGVVAGFGLGLCYICPVSACQKWFPDRRGLASGFAVCGFGAGSIAIAKVQLPLIHSVGLPLTFVVLGCIYFVCMAVSALVLRTPPANYVVNGLAPDGTRVGGDPEGKKGLGTSEGSLARVEEAPKPKMPLIEALTSWNYRLMYVMLLGNSIFGLVLISRFSNMVQQVFGRDPDIASTVVSINGGFNLGGRLAFSIVSDYIGRKWCYVIMLTSQLIIVGCFATITSTGTYWAFLMTMWILTACYGAGFGVIPAFLTDHFGPQNIGACHGIILTAWSLAGVVGGLIFTAVFNAVKDPQGPISDPHPYNINAWWIFVVVLIGWVCLLFVEPTYRDVEFGNKMRSIATTIMNKLRKRKEPQSQNENGFEERRAVQNP